MSKREKIAKIKEIIRRLVVRELEEASTTASAGAANPMGTGIAQTFLLNEFEIYVLNNIVKIAGSNVDKTYKIKVGRSAAKNIAYICKNQEKFLK